MRNNFRLFVFILSFLLCLSLPRLGALEDIPFDNPDITISMDFQDASLKDVLKILSMQSGLNFIASEAVKERKMTLYFDKVPLKLAMDKLFLANNLSYVLDKNSNVFYVKDWGKPEVELETKVFYLKYASVSSSHIMEEVQSTISSSDTGSTGGEDAGSSESTSGDRYAVSTDIGITTAIKKLLSKDGAVIEDYRTNSLIVQDIPSRLPIIAKTIEKLDVPMPQVLIEVEMLDVSKTLVDKLGFNWGQTPLTMTLTGPQYTGFGLANWPTFVSQGLSGKSSSMTPGTMNFNTA
ncbi:MAG: secretin N-terminal domain-containing protein, partial [Candidatus Omnitrophota bacterium]